MIEPFQPLRDLLYATFRGLPTPVLMGEDFGIPGASIWSGSRLWLGRFRELGLQPGDRVVVALRRSPAMVMASIACWWEGLTVCLAEPTSANAALLDVHDARLLVGAIDHPHVLRPVHDDVPDSQSPTTLRRASSGGTRAAVMFGPGRPLGPGCGVLRADALWRCLNSAAERLALSEVDVVLSVQPWHEPFGCLVDLWASLISGTTVIASMSDPMDAAGLGHEARSCGATRLNVCEAAARAVVNADVLIRGPIASCRGFIAGGSEQHLELPGLRPMRDAADLSRLLMVEYQPVRARDNPPSVRRAA